MSDMGICEYCKYKDLDMTKNPCLDCSAQLGAFNFDMTEHDAQVRACAIDALVRMVAKYYTMQERAGYYSDTNNMIKQRIADFGEQLKGAD